MPDDKQSLITVLLVEDDVSFAHTLKLRLSRGSLQKVDVVHVESLSEATHYCMQSASQLTLILVDLFLPDSSGIETYSKIKVLAEDIPVVILSGLENDQLALDAVRLGAEDYLVKAEVDGKMILRVMLHAIERNRIKKELARVTQKLRETNLRLERMTILDPLTELLNRRGFQQALSREIQWVKRHHKELLAIMIDIDHFKEINDTYGYAVGDSLLRMIGFLLRKNMRLTDHIARIGGDEIIILLPETPFDEAMKIAERIRLSVASEAFLLSKNKKVGVTASLALATVPSQMNAIDELLARLHPLLRSSKEGGRNRLAYQQHDPKLYGEPNFVPEQQIGRLQNQSNYFALKQPIVRLQDGEVVGYEFLCRHKDPAFQMPDDFFRLAHENSMLTLVDKCCINVCAEAAKKIPNGMKLHINILPTTLIDVPVAHLMETLETAGDIRRFCLEISEQQIIGDPSYLLDTIQTLREAGILIAIDDVGFGHSCLESLVFFEPDIIKIDRSCLSFLQEDQNKQRALKRFLDVARSLETQVVVEGVEQQENVLFLQDIGVVYAQGFLFGKPQ